MAKPKITAPVGASLIVLSSVFYASYGIWTTLMGDAFGGYVAAGLRSIGVLLILLPIAMVAKQLEPLRLGRTWLYLVGMFATALFVWGPLYYAVLHAGVGISLTVNYACIVIGMLFFGWLIGKEELTKSKLVAAGVGIVGLTLIYLPSISGIGWLALGAAALSGIMCALNMVFVKLIPYGATQSVTAGWVTSAIANVSMALILRETIPAIGWDLRWLYLGAFIIASVVSSWAFTAGMKAVGAGAAGILGLLEIVFAVLIGAIFFDERPGLVVLLGVATIIVSAAIPYIESWQVGHRSARQPGVAAAKKA